MDFINSEKFSAMSGSYLGTPPHSLSASPRVFIRYALNFLIILSMFSYPSFTFLITLSHYTLEVISSAISKSTNFIFIFVSYFI